MLIYWDANALASRHATGIVVYGSYLLKALQQYDDLEFIGLLKLAASNGKNTCRATLTCAHTSISPLSATGF